ncbi:MAG TPA: di-heme oxidoredictase family protein [Mucilaginibacter sp.]|nr:di-heme oxidoredictase family protein [Mucilaginibacter sp.]
MSKRYIIISGLFIMTLAITIGSISSCKKLMPDMIDPNFGVCGPVDDLTNSQTILFSKGNDQFFAIRDAASGLGPYFVSNSCGGCHSSDNRGHPFTILTRFGQTDSTGNKFLGQGGPQLGSNNLPGYTAEQIPAGATSSKFIAPITAGVGFLEAVPDTEIIAMAHRNANNPDGVRGHPNYNTVPANITPLYGSVPRADGKYICRFGRKASTYSLVQQTAAAYNHDMGITSAFMPVNPYNYLDQAAPPVSSPEINNDDFNSVVFYVTCLQTPNQRNVGDQAVKRGNALFVQIGCETCHKQTLTTGYSPIPALSNKTISPFTDLLVHDMGPALDDGYTEGDAKTSEWRTTPLWGLGLARNVQGGNIYLMHDGRAHSIREAIKLHGGEAAVSAARFGKLNAQDQSAVITFLNSL